MTLVAAIVLVVLVTVPSTRTGSPAVMARAQVRRFPSRYVVEDASSAVTV
jgi:hypothetical protein